MTRRQLPRRPPPTGRAARHLATCALLGSLVLTGPWTTFPAASGQDAKPPRPSSPSSVAGRAAPPSPAIPFEPPAVPGVVPLPFWAVTRAEAWTAPVAGYEISAPYGLPGSWAAGYHTGVDFATPVGVPVSAVGPGTVEFAGESGDYGNLVIARMSDGHYTLYAHLSEISVSPGETVAANVRVGISGDTGRSTGPHLHFEVRTSSEYGTDVDPVAYLASHGVHLA